MSSLPPSFHETFILPSWVLPTKSSYIIDSGAGKLNETLSLLKKQLEEITGLNKKVISQRLPLRVSFW